MPLRLPGGVDLPPGMEDIFNISSMNPLDVINGGLNPNEGASPTLPSMGTMTPGAAGVPPGAPAMAPAGAPPTEPAGGGGGVMERILRALAIGAPAFALGAAGKSGGMGGAGAVAQGINRGMIAHQEQLEDEARRALQTRQLDLQEQNYKAQQLATTRKNIQDRLAAVQAIEDNARERLGEIYDPVLFLRERERFREQFEQYGEGDRADRILFSSPALMKELDRDAEDFAKQGMAEWFKNEKNYKPEERQARWESLMLRTRPSAAYGGKSWTLEDAFRVRGYSLNAPPGERRTSLQKVRIDRDTSKMMELGPDEVFDEYHDPIKPDKPDKVTPHIIYYQKKNPDGTTEVRGITVPADGSTVSAPPGWTRIGESGGTNSSMERLQQILNPNAANMTPAPPGGVPQSPEYIERTRSEPPPPVFPPGVPDPAQYQNYSPVNQPGIPPGYVQDGDTIRPLRMEEMSPPMPGFADLPEPLQKLLLELERKRTSKKGFAESVGFR